VDAEEEAALVRRVADGDRTAFHSLVLRHQRPLSGYARRMLLNTDAADDVVQETLLRLWSRADRYDPKAARLTTWLHRVAHNLCVDMQRRSARVLPLPEGWDGSDGQSDSMSDGRHDSHGPEAALAAENRAHRIRAAIATLPERQRSALLLCHYQGMSNRQAAEVLGVGVEALESLLSRARRRLRQDMESEL
jgi:RNA polymerase sigma-70 factor (ECF subfamily)